MKLFEGHIVQIDYKDSYIKRLHLEGFDGSTQVSLVLHFEPPEVEVDRDVPLNGSLAYFPYEARPKITIERDYRPGWG